MEPQINSITTSLYEKYGGLHTLLFLTGIAYLIYLIGYPIFFPDSSRYLQASAFLQTGLWQPNSLGVLLRPLYLNIGPWAFVIFNCICMTISSLLFSKTYFGQWSHIEIFTAILVSGAFVSAASIMMDIQVAFAFLSFLILIKRKSPTAFVILVLCLLTHMSAIPIIAIVSIVVSIYQLRMRPIKVYIIAVIASLVISNAGRYLTEGQISSMPRNSIQFVLARVMADVPQAIDSFAKAYPNTEIAKHRSSFSMLSNPRDAGKYLWPQAGKNKAPFPLIGHEKINKEANKFIFFSIVNFPIEHTIAILSNPVRFFLAIGDDSIRHAFIRGPKIAEKMSLRFWPEGERMMKMGAQYQNRIQNFVLNGFLIKGFYVSFIGLLLFFIFSTFTPYKNSNIAFLAFSATVFCIANAFVMSNFGGGVSSGRAHVKMFYVTILVFILMSSFNVKKYFAIEKK